MNNVLQTYLLLTKTQYKFNGVHMQSEAWYRNPWVWLIIAFPVASILGGIATIIITSQNQPDMVIDDYYKEGKAINRELSLYQKAKELNIKMEIKIQSGRIELKSNTEFPALKVKMAHSTLEDKDFEFIATPNAVGTLSTVVDESTDGKWIIFVMPMDESWKIKANIIMPTESWMSLQ